MVFKFHELESFEKIDFKFTGKFLMELEYHEKLEFPNSSTQKVIDPYIFLKQ